MKIPFYKQLGSIVKPGAIFGSNTSSLKIADFARPSGRPEKFVSPILRGGSALGWMWGLGVRYQIHSTRRPAPGVPDIRRGICMYRWACTSSIRCS